MSLLKVELRRFFARRSIRVGSIALVLAVIGATLFGVSEVNRVDEVRASLAMNHRFDVQDWERDPESWREDCIDRYLGDLGPEKAAEECANGPGPAAPEVEASVDSLISGQFEVLSPITFVFAFIIGALFVSAEFSAGTLSTWLTFEPRRGRVFTSKVNAALLGSLAFVVAACVLSLIIGLVLGLLLGLPVAGNGYARISSDELPGYVLRTIGLAGLAAIAGAALSGLLRNAAAVIAAVFGAIIISDAILHEFVTRPERWLLSVNLSSFVWGGTRFEETFCHGPLYDRTCDSTFYYVTTAHSAGFLVAVVAVCALAGAWAFVRRDVT